MSCPVVWDKKNLLLGKYINFNCTCNFKSSLAQWPRVKVSHPLTKSIINNLKQEGALGKQNVTAACPKDKLEYIFFWSLLRLCSTCSKAWWLLPAYFCPWETRSLECFSFNPKFQKFWLLHHRMDHFDLV